LITFDPQVFTAPLLNDFWVLVAEEVSMTTTLPGGVRQLPFDFLPNQRPKWPPNHGIHGIHGLTKEECIDLLFSRHLSRPCGRCGFLTYAEQLVRWAVWDTCGW